MENEEDESDESREEEYMANIEQEATIADIDDDPKQIDSPVHSRQRRANAGAGVERLQMNFSGKGMEQVESLILL